MNIEEAVVRLKQANLLAKITENGRIVGGRTISEAGGIKVYNEGFAIWNEGDIYYGGIADNGNLGTRMQGLLDDVVAFIIERYFPKVLGVERLSEKDRFRVRLTFGTFDMSVRELPDIGGARAIEAPSEFHRELHEATFDAAGMRAITRAIIKACIS